MKVAKGLFWLGTLIVLLAVMSAEKPGPNAATMPADQASADRDALITQHVQKAAEDGRLVGIGMECELRGENWQHGIEAVIMTVWGDKELPKNPDPDERLRVYRVIKSALDRQEEFGHFQVKMQGNAACEGLRISPGLRRLDGMAIKGNAILEKMLRENKTLVPD